MRLDARPLGILLIVIGAVLAMIAVLITWRTVDRFRVNWALTDWHGMVMLNDLPGQRSAARDAGLLWPGHPAVALAAIDLAAPGAAEQLAAIPAAGSAASAREAATAINAALNGKEVTGGGSDVALAKVIARPDGPWPTTDRSSPPFKSTLGAALAARLASAWKAGRADDLRHAAGGLLLLYPRHPDAPELTLICAALDPDAERSLQAIPSAGGQIGDAARRIQLARALYALAPESKPLATLAFGGITDPEVLARKRLEEDASLAASSKTPDQVLIRLAQAGRFDLATPLIAKLEPRRQAPFAGMAALTNATLATIPADPRAKPLISRPVTRSGLIAFHITNRFGGSFTDPVVIVIEGKEIPPELVKRMGSLIWSEVAKTGAGDVAIRLGSETLFAERLTF
jgi:hypothetical protein